MCPSSPPFRSGPDQDRDHPQQVGLLGLQSQVTNSGNLGNANLTIQFPCSCPHQIPSQSHVLVPVMDAFRNQTACLSNFHGNGVSVPYQPVPILFTSFPNGAAYNLPGLQHGLVGTSPCHQMVQIVQLYNTQSPNQMMQSPTVCLRPQNFSRNMPMQPNGQFYSHNSPQSLNQMAAFQNGQLCSQNMTQNSNQAMPVQSSQQPMVQTDTNPSMACPKQVQLIPSSQNSVPPMNSQFGNGNSTTIPRNMVLPNEAFNNQGQMHKSPKNMQSNGYQQLKGSNVDSSGNNITNTNQGNPTGNNFRGDGKGTNKRFQKSKMHNEANVKGHFRRAHGSQGKGKHNKGAEQSQLAYSGKKTMGECQRYSTPNYTEEEIQQRRASRRKNFPSKTNTEKQLREIPAKHAEMGVEVAELPPNSPENQASQKELGNQCGKRNEWRFSNKRDRSHNQFDRRDNKHEQQNRLAKKARLGG